jgi:phosphoenolpyruvate phosphomutase
LVDLSGFDAVWASGLEVSATYMMPDAGILSMTEFLRAADAINEAASIPVVADCDCGFGDAPQVARLVHEYERRGIAGICIEDKAFPKTNSFAPGPQRLVSIEHFAEKIRAAGETRTDSDLVLFARTEAFIAGTGVDEALQRALAYEAAGADAIVVHSKAETACEIAEFMKSWPNRVPVVVVPTAYPDVTLEELQSMGIRMVIFANVVLRSMIAAVKRVLARLAKRGTLGSVEDELVALNEVLALQDEYFDRIRSRGPADSAADDRHPGPVARRGSRLLQA